MEERLNTTDRCLNLWALAADFFWEEMCIISQHVSIIARNQENFE
jgi:hypothetical protein